LSGPPLAALGFPVSGAQSVWTLRHSAQPRPRNRTTSAAFFPHLEQGIRSASSLSDHLPADQVLKALRLNLAAGDALADHAHEEIAETIIELRYVGQYPHGRMVMTASASLHSVCRPWHTCMSTSQVTHFLCLKQTATFHVREVH